MHYLGILLSSVFFDMRNMDSDLKTTMAENVKKADFVVFMCTDRFKERATATGQTRNNLQFEIDTVLECVKTGSVDRVVQLVREEYRSCNLRLF